jgi:hypothetical protein
MNAATPTLRQRCSNLHVAFVLVWLTLTLPAFSQTSLAADDLKFEVLSVRQMTPKEKFDYTVDCIDCADVYVTVRLTAGAQPLSFYTWPEWRNPSTFRVKQEGRRTFWINSWEESEWPATSPGMKKLLDGFRGAWKKLGPHQSVQWREVDTTHFAGQSRAYSAFVRIAQGPPQEIFSSSFLIPPDTNPPEPRADVFERGVSCLLAQDTIKASLREVETVPGGAGALLYQSGEIGTAYIAAPSRINVLFLSPNGKRARLFSFRIAKDGSILALRGGYRLTRTRGGYRLTRTGESWSADQGPGSLPPAADVSAYVNRMVHDNPALKFHLVANAEHCAAE